MNRSHSQESHECRFCGRRDYTDTPGLALGRCKTCKGGRWVRRDYPEPLTVQCSCGVHAALTERVRDEYAARDAADAAIEEHIQTDHRAEWIAERMGEIERDARWASARQHSRYSGTQPDPEWSTDALAVEYRALMREWWEMPSVPEDARKHSPSVNRTLTGKGSLQDTRSHIPANYSLPWAKAVERHWPEQWAMIKELPIVEQRLHQARIKAEG